MSALPIVDAARALDMPPGRLRRLVRQGAPVVARGGRGRGRATLVCPAAVRAWLGSDSRDALVLELAAAVPGIVAQALHAAWQSADGLPKGRLAGVTAASWFVVTTALTDYLRAANPAVPEIDRLPPEIEHLRKIAEIR